MTARKPHKGCQEQTSFAELAVARLREACDDTGVRELAARLSNENEGHLSRVGGCPGCDLFGVCAFHAPPTNPGVRARSIEQREAWARGGYGADAELEPEPEASIQDVVQTEEKNDA